MRLLTRPLLLVAALALAIGLAGCSKSEAPVDETAVAPADAPAEQNEVMAALDRKDYDAVVQGIAKAKAAVATPEQETAFVNLVDEVKIRLLDEAPSSPKANEALAVIRGLTGGR